MSAEVVISLSTEEAKGLINDLVDSYNAITDGKSGELARWVDIKGVRIIFLGEQLSQISGSSGSASSG